MTTQVRVYVPATLDLLAGFVAAGRIDASVERFVAPGDDEESEYAALVAAAESSRELGPGRRVVVVAEVGDVDGDLPRRTWAAVHADPDADVGADIRDDDDLCWFAVQEIESQLLGGEQ